MELLVAIALLGMVVGTTAVTLAAHARNVRELFEEKVALQLATGEIEALEARGFDASPGTARLLQDSTALAQLPAGVCNLIVTRDAEDLSLLRAQVVVTWRCGRHARTAEMDTWFRRAP